MDRAEAIRILDPETRPEALAEIEYYHGFNGPTAKAETVLEAISVALAALRELTQSQWISVKDDLPQKDGSYLVATKNGGVMLTHFYTKSKSFSSKRLNRLITHWMERPKPPEGDAE